MSEDTAGSRIGDKKKRYYTVLCTSCMLPTVSFIVGALLLRTKLQVSPIFTCDPKPSQKPHFWNLSVPFALMPHAT